jgi:beta-glucosidase
MTKQLSVIPTKRSEVWWLQRHQQKLAEVAELTSPTEYLFLGDSITHAWEVEGEGTWQQYFGHMSALNLGYAGDRTEHLLWRIQNGEIDNLEAKWIILLIGTNNAGHRLDPPEEISAGVNAILLTLKTRLPHSKIVLMAIFPRSRNNHKPMRQRLNLTNQLIKQLTDNQQVFWLDINQHFLNDDGVLLESVMPDLLHPNSAQYEVWAQQIQSLLIAKGY